MNSEEYQKVKEIFQEVLELPPGARAAQLAARCPDDAVRREVERLLNSYDSEYLEKPVIADRTSLDALSPGKQIGHYNVVRKIGSGGMGEVYLAEDGKLGRQVAIKLLPEAFTKDEDRLRRFQQEARTASALNHPNILTIHEVGEIDDTHYIATEYIDGETLREKLSRSKLAVSEALDIAVQCASALAAAHEAGIIHRDIKPENIMLRRDNLVKVLDFGIAKLVQKKETSVSHNALTEKHLKTEPGLIMGTVQYMSPEQTRGHATDPRTDIWSLGCVIYEMVTGRPAFVGDNSADLIAEIVLKQPSRLADSVAGIPERLDEIGAKCLEKRRERRYQTVTDLLDNLNDLKRRVDTGLDTNNSRPVLPVNGRMTDATIFTAVSPTNLEKSPNNKLKNAPNKFPAINASSVAHILGGRSQHKFRTAILLLSVAASVSSIGFGLHYLLKPVIPRSPQLSLLTKNGKSEVSAISRDGKYAAFVIVESGKESVWLKHLPTDATTQIIPPAELSYSRVAFSPEGDYLYYLKTPGSGEFNSGEIHKISIFDGTHAKIAGQMDSSFAIAPDESRVAFPRWNNRSNSSTLIVANTDGSGELTVHGTRGWVDFPTFLNSGSELAVLSGGSAQDETEVLVFDLDGDLSLLKSFPIHGLQNISDLTWVSEQEGFLMIANEKRDRSAQIWGLLPGTDRPVRITNDFNSYRGLSVTSDKRLVTVQISHESEIWVAEKGAIRNARQITSGSGNDGGMGLSWAGDQIVYSSISNSKWDIWIMDSDGNNQRQLTRNSGTNIEPTVCLESRYVVFVSDRSGAFHVWRMDIDGDNPVQLTTNPGGRWPQCLDGERSVVYQSLNVRADGFSERPSNLWKIPIEGGAQIQIRDREGESAEQPVISTNGDIAYFTDHDVRVAFWGGRQPQKLMSLSTTEFRVLEEPFYIRLPYLKWLPEGDGLAYVKINGGKSELWKIGSDNRKEERISEFDGDRVYFDWSNNNKDFAYRKVSSKSDVLLITDW